MKRKLSLFLILCLLISGVCPQTQVYAAEQMENVWQKEASTEEKLEDTIEEIKDEEKVEEEEVQQRQKIVVECISSNSLLTSEENLSETEEVTAMEEDVLETTAVTLTQADIPDNALWTYLVEQYGSGGVLTTDDMLGIKELIIPKYKYIKNLKGIEYAVNLQVFSVENNEVTDEGVIPLLSCTKLESINLKSNRLTTMPDFSKMTKLTTLNVEYNFIPKEEITASKCPTGVKVEEVGKQYFPTEIQVVDGIVYKDATESGTYGVALEVISAPWYTDSVRIRITDITGGYYQLLYDESDISCTTYYPNSTDDYYGYRNLKVDVTELTAIEGTREWEIVCSASGEKVTEVVTVTVDPDGMGGFQEVPDSILPKELSEYWVNYSYNKYDQNKDGMISFLELASITFVSLGSREETSLQLDSYGFLPYMKKLNNLFLTGETNFTQESLQYLTSLKELSWLALDNVGEIRDISILKDVPKLNWISIEGYKNISGLPELKGKKVPIEYIYADEGTFSDVDIFDYILNQTEKSIAIGLAETMILSTPVMQSMEEVQVAVSEEGVIGYKEENPFYLYGTGIGETDITYTLGEISHTIHVTVIGTKWDSDPELGTVVEESKRLHFAGTEGVVNARASKSMIDGEKNIWDISTRTPEKILEGKDYTKYAARLIYGRSYRFSTETNSPNRWDDCRESFYLDTQGTLWIFDKESTPSDYNYRNRYEIMQDVADWQEGGYSENDYWMERTILIQKTDGSLWYGDFEYGYESKYGEDGKIEYGVRYLRPNRLEKLEDEGVTGVYPNSYLKDGILYRVDENGEKFEVAENIVQVWNNTTIVLAQDKEGKYYTTQGEIEVTGTIKEFMMSNCWDSGYLKEDDIEGNGVIWIETERDMIAGYLLMDNGNLYRSIYSRDICETDFVLVDTDVKALEKDYYWKDDTCYWFTGETYAEYIGDGLGKGLYPVWEKDTDTEQESMTLYVHGIPYLTKVADWTVADECIYAVRLDNTLWQFDDENTPHQVDFSSLNSSKKEVGTKRKEIQILDLQETEEGVQVKWSAVEGVHSYRIYATSADDSEIWMMTGDKVTEYLIEPYKENRCYYRIEAVDKDGEVLASSWKFYTEIEGTASSMNFRLTDWQGKEIYKINEAYTLSYDSTMKGKKLYLDITMKNIENPEFTAKSSASTVVKTKVQGQRVELTLQGSGTATIQVTEKQSGAKSSIYLNLKKTVAPKVKVTLKEKLNLFYKDAKALYQLTNTAGTISKVEFVPAKGSETFFRVSFDSSTKELSLIPKTSESGKSLFDLEGKDLTKALKGQLKVTIGSTTLTHKISIATSNKGPRVTLTETSRKVYKFTPESGGEPIYVGTFIQFQPIDGRTGEVLESATVTLTNCKGYRKGELVQNFVPEKQLGSSQSEYLLTKNADGAYDIRFVGKSTARAIIKIQEDNWAKPISVNYKVTVSNGKIKGKLSAAKVTLNKEYTGDQKNLVLTANLPYTGFSLGAWEVTKLPKGAEDSAGLKVQKESDGLGFVLSESSKGNLKEGNYMIKIPVTLRFAEGVSYTPQPLYVKVNVIHKEMSKKDVKWKVSGILDIIDRENSGLTIQPVFSGINATLVSAAFGDSDKISGMDKKFTLQVEDGKLKVKLKPGISVYTKEKNKISPVLTVETSNGTRHILIETSDINTKLVQSNVKVIPLKKTLTMQKSKETTLSQLVSYDLQASEGVEITNVESAVSGFEASLYGDGKIQIRMTDSELKVKTHTVKVKVYLKDQATNAKPVTMNVKVVVKK